ncbi:MAG: late competence development ComFB family protein [Bacillota bacterium]
MIENYTEILVKEVLEEYKKNFEVCKCENCNDDIICTVLNKLPQKYFLSMDGEAVKKAFLLDKQLRLKALIEISAAASEICEKLK